MKRAVARALLLFLLVPAFAAPAPTASRPPETREAISPAIRPLIERLDAQAAAELAKDGVGGLSVGVVHGGRLVWTKSYGLADAEGKLPAKDDAIYRIGSVTKSFTALMLLQLVQEGKVHLSDPVEKYLPEIAKLQGRPSGAPPITLVQLATHTSGLDREPEDTETYLKGPVAGWEKVLLAALPHTHFAFEPGTRYSYSNVGYAILGVALSRAAGQPYTEYIEQRIFQPLGMTDSSFEPRKETRARLATGYLSEDEKVDAETPRREHEGRGYKVPNGAMYSTVADLARFVAFELGGGPESVLKKENLETSFEQIVASDPQLARGYGLGLQVIRRGEAVLTGHSGGVAGYEAQMFFERSSGTGVVILRNAVGGSFDTGSLLRAAFTNPAAPK